MLAGRVVGHLALLVALVAVAGVLAPRLGVERSLAGFSLVALAGIGLWAGVFAPLWLGWRRAGDTLRQARRIERLRPELQGRLLTAVERLAGPRGAESPAILNLIAARAHERVRDLRDSAVHPGWPVLVTWAPLPLVVVLALGIAALSPQGFAGLLDYWMPAGSQAVAALDDAAGDGVERARVGDVLLEYVYPSYTGLEPLEVPNSTGDVHGPPGTQVRVRVRSAEVVEGAALVAYDEPTPATRVDEGRIITGSFTILDDDGTWHLDLMAGEAQRRSRSFQITVEPDLPPVVLVDSPARVEVPLNAPIDLPWAARDDFGLTRVALFLDEVERSEIRRLTSPVAETSGTLSITPEQLGMSIGMRVRLQIGAYDNNAWAGEQLGLSAPAIEIVVTDPDKLQAMDLDKREELRDVLVDLLAGQLLEPWPPGRTHGAVLGFGERFDDLYDPLRAWMADNPGWRQDMFIRLLLSRALVAGTDAVSYTQSQFEPSAASRGVALEQLGRAGELREQAIKMNEQAIVLLDRYLARDALQLALERSGRVATLSANLQASAKTRESTEALQFASRRVSDALDDLGRQGARMSSGSLGELIERRVLEMAAVRQTFDTEVQGGDRGEQTAARLARMAEELSEELRYRLRSLDDEDNETVDLIKQLLQELSALERDQRGLQRQVRAARDTSDAREVAEADRLWSEVEKLTEQAVDLGAKTVASVPENAAFYARDRLAASQRLTERLQQSVRARDLRKAVGDVDDALAAWMRAGRLGNEAGRQGVMQRLERAQRTLMRMQAEAGTVSPQVADQARALDGEQGQLASRRDEVERQSHELLPRLPIEPVGMIEALQAAQEQMTGARAELQRGRPMPAEGAQGQAAEQVRDARRALEAVLQGMQGGQGQQGGEGSEGGDQDEDQQGIDFDGANMLSSRELDLDDEFDLDAFQRDVLRGMQGDVPDAYRALKKRYYEELMTQ